MTHFPPSADGLLQWMALLPGLNQIPEEAILGVFLGIAISAACGFRVFMPPLVLCAGALFFNIPVPEEMAWMASYPVLITLLVAALAEMAAYYIPWVDNLLDTAATPLSMVAGTIISGTLFGGAFHESVSPLIQWSFALIAGGGAAGAVSALTSGSRVTSSTLTLGLANPLVATVENVMAIALPVLSMVFPVVALVAGLIGLVLVLATALIIVSGIALHKRRAKAPQPSGG